jgi:uncharacterized membrane protein YbhN (UPF0104 family)
MVHYALPKSHCYFVSFSSYFLSLVLPFMFIHKPLFRLYLTEAIIVKSASIISNVVRAVDSGLVNTSQKGRRND